MLMDRRSGEHSEAVSVQGKTRWSDTPGDLEQLEKSLIFHGNPQTGTLWNVLQDDGSEQPKKLTRNPAGLNPEQFAELQTPQEKWYGYCLTEDDCFIPSSTPESQPRQQPEVKFPANTHSHRPGITAWILAMKQIALSTFCPFFYDIFHPWELFRFHRNYSVKHLQILIIAACKPPWLAAAVWHS
jgi:hypothetical protein